MPNVTHDPLVHAELLRQRPGPTLIELRDGGARGLVFTVLPSGRKLWSIRYVFRGRHRRLGLGEFPAVSLAKARNAAGDVRTAIRAGHDPYGERQAAKARPTDTLAALADAYVKGHARPRKKTGAEDERILTVDVIPHLGDRSVRRSRAGKFAACSSASRRAGRRTLPIARSKSSARC